FFGVKHFQALPFSQGSLNTEQILSSIRHLMVEGGIKASTLVIDGFDFQKSNPENLAKVHAFAVEMGVEIWFSATLPIDGQLSAKGKAPTILAAFMPSIAVLVVLDPKTEYIHFDVVKHHESTNLEDLKIKLDPKTLLIADV
ncbi:MAG: hypothetical protein ACOYM2_01365, partial [Rectinemataceae bacterium]